MKQKINYVIVEDEISDIDNFNEIIKDINKENKLNATFEYKGNADNIKSAFDLIKKEKPALVFLDIKLFNSRIEESFTENNFEVLCEEFDIPILKKVIKPSDNIDNGVYLLLLIHKYIDTKPFIISYSGHKEEYESIYEKFGHDFLSKPATSRKIEKILPKAIEGIIGKSVININNRKDFFVDIKFNESNIYKIDEFILAENIPCDSKNNFFIIYTTEKKHGDKYTSPRTKKGTLLKNNLFLKNNISRIQFSNNSKFLINLDFFTIKENRIALKDDIKSYPELLEAIEDLNNSEIQNIKALLNFTN